MKLVHVAGKKAMYVTLEGWSNENVELKGIVEDLVGRLKKCSVALTKWSKGNGIGIKPHYVWFIKCRGKQQVGFLYVGKLSSLFNHREREDGGGEHDGKCQVCPQLFYDIPILTSFQVVLAASTQGATLVDDCYMESEVGDNDVVQRRKNNVLRLKSETGRCSWDFDEALSDVKPVISKEENDALIGPVTQQEGLLPKFISKSQKAFMAGGLIQDNVIIPHKVLHYLKNKKRGEKFKVAIKMDMKNAYEGEWDILEVVLRKLGFCNQWVNRIM
ncbi:putative RNA-directed DNA polymerase [Senna tora]|uniref:Putative RNA-directed DNA polymerase n=1 Tax=Senna tora TaxID=362788 RepID=A0A834WT41_9FABA|nr:putative RNA-directed DNA polymerase [Senna tora]